MKNKNYKSELREYLRDRSNDIQDEIDEKEEEIISILRSENKNWAKVQELAERANTCINEWALLEKLIGLDKKKIAKEIEDKELAKILCTF